MKKVLFSVLLSFVINGLSFSQNQEIITSNLSKDALWANLTGWVSKSFNDYEAVVDSKDKEEGFIILKSKNKINDESYFMKEGYIQAYVSYTIKIDVRDKKYRYTIIDQNGEISMGSLYTGDMAYPTKKRYLQKLEFILDFSERFANKNMSFDVSKLDKAIKYYNSKLESIPQYKNKKKTKENKEYTELNENIQFLRFISDSSDLVLSDIISSLKKNMDYVDDF